MHAIKFALIALLLISSTAFCNYIVTVEAQETIVYVDPGRVTGLEIDEIFRVEIKVENVTDLKAWEIKVFYKSTVLNASAITPPEEKCPFFNEKAPDAEQFYGIYNFTDNFNETHGQIIAYCALYNVESGVSGSGTLLWIDFKAVGSGDSPIDIGPVFEGTTILRDSNADPIPHQTLDGVVHVGLRDVAITKIEAPKSIPTNTVAKINVTAENQGEVSQTFDVTLYYDEVPIETKTLFNMSGGAVEILTYYWDVSLLPIGEYTLWAEATKVPGEADLADNKYIFGTVYIGLKDVAIIDLKPSKTITNDTTIYFNVTVQNQGEIEETFNVTLYYGTRIVGVQTIINLTAGAITSLNFTLNTIIVPKGMYMVRAEATTVPGEIDLDDNTYIYGYLIETILGDVTGDYKVDIVDISQIARAYETTPGHPRWNPNADLNNDSIVNIIDISMAARNYGKEI